MANSISHPGIEKVSQGIRTHDQGEVTGYEVYRISPALSKRLEIASWKERANLILPITNFYALGGSDRGFTFSNPAGFKVSKTRLLVKQFCGKDL